MSLTRNHVLDRLIWHGLAPGLHIEAADILKPCAGPNLLDEREVAGLGREGYVHLRSAIRNLDFAPMAKAARALSARGLDPTFAFVYDEFWRAFFQLDAIYRQLLGDYALLPNFWAWNVDPEKGEAGWGPHRDQGAHGLMPDGAPKSLTTWLPLSEATPLNGCLYIVPADQDPTYGTREDAQWRFDHASIRALPASPGDVLIWNHAVLHWGGKSSPNASESRVSISMEAQRLDQPLVSTPAIAPWEIVPFETRLRMIGEKILHYRHMTAMAPDLEALANELVG